MGHPTPRGIGYASLRGKDLRNVIKAFQLDEPYDESICLCGFYADYVRSKLVERIATGEVTRKQVDWFCPVLIQTGA
jgi:hypothetical protein